MKTWTETDRAEAIKTLLLAHRNSTQLTKDIVKRAVELEYYDDSWWQRFEKYRDDGILAWLSIRELTPEIRAELQAEMLGKEKARLRSLSDAELKAKLGTQAHLSEQTIAHLLDVFRGGLPYTSDDMDRLRCEAEESLKWLADGLDGLARRLNGEKLRPLELPLGRSANNPLRIEMKESAHCLQRTLEKVDADRDRRWAARIKREEDWLRGLSVTRLWALARMRGADYNPDIQHADYKEVYDEVKQVLVEEGLTAEEIKELIDWPVEGNALGEPPAEDQPLENPPVRHE
jgi:hypothetical protein